MSTDATINLIERLPEANRIRIIANERRIQASGMNRGIEIAQGEVIVRVDGHTIIGADYIRQCVGMLLTTNAYNVGGSIHPVAHTALGYAIASASKSPFAIPSTFRIGAKMQYVDTVYMGAWWRKVFDHIGNFDEGFVTNEDYELNHRIRAAGGQILYLPDLCSEYHGQETLRGLARQYFRYGCSKPRTIHKHPASVHLRHLAAPALTAFMIIGGIFTVLFGETAFLWLGSIVVYLMGVMLFTFHSARKYGCHILLKLPSVYLTIHLAWGCGFWYGVVHMLKAQFEKSRLSLS
jgi:GT2 family glycosyltransferase